ncbi:MAG TPA: 50S ribosomal protein L25 [Candidatus Andersenbacteria bacterium]|nr:50S ribosomal protein L25 [Candidatus Andersenbacteria bacterium]
MADELQLSANIRSGHVGAIRREGNIPAVLYGHGITPQNVEVESRQFQKLFTGAGYTTMLTLAIEGGESHPVFIRDVQFHPLKSTVTHIDFYKVRMDEVIKAKVPLKFIGESPAVKLLSGVLVRNMDELEVEALPKDLPHDIEVDISSLVDFEKALHVKDITLPSGVITHKDLEEVIALVQPPRSEAELEALSEEVKEDVESVEGVKKEVPAEEGAEGAEGKDPASAHGATAGKEDKKGE